jgi:hypothetical protein
VIIDPEQNLVDGKNPCTTVIRLEYLEDAYIVIDRQDAVRRAQFSIFTRFLIGVLRWTVALTFPAAVSVFLDRGDRRPDQLVAVAVVGAIGFLAIFGPAMRRWLNRKTLEHSYARLDAKARWVCWTITSTDVEARNSIASNTMKWQGFRRAIEFERGILLFDFTNTYFWFPAARLGSRDEAGIVIQWARQWIKRYQVVRPLVLLDKPSKPFHYDEL